MPVKIFFCYAHEDEMLLNKLKAHLRPLQRQGLIDVWHDRDIGAGIEWEQEIKEQLNIAQVILLLVSPDFMNSDYCYSIEMQRAIERHERGEARVIPIILRPVYWQGVLGKLQALPTDAIPVMSSGWHYQDEAFFNVTEGITKAIGELAANLEASPKIDELQTRQDNKSYPENPKFAARTSATIPRRDSSGQATKEETVSFYKPDISYRGLLQPRREIDKQLRIVGQEPGEHLRLVLRKHPLFFFRNATPLVCSLAILLSILLIQGLNSNLNQIHILWILLDIFTCFSIVLSIYFFFYKGLIWWYEAALITSKRIIKWTVRGQSLKFTYQEVPHEKVTRLMIEQDDIWSTFLNYGNINVYFVGGEVVIEKIPRPKIWLDFLQDIFQ